MKKKYTKKLLEESLNNIRKLITKDGTGCFNQPNGPSSCYPASWTEETADYIRDERVKLYVTSWIIPNIEKAIAELSK